MRVVAFLLLAAGAVAAVAAVNFVLLGYGGTSDDPVGRMTPRTAELMARSGEQATRPPAASPADDNRADSRGGDDEHRDRDDDD
jgi:hypothetical protein